MTMVISLDHRSTTHSKDERPSMIVAFAFVEDSHT
jgi:hypothetical protein